MNGLLCSETLAIDILASMVLQQREEIAYLRALLSEVTAAAQIVEARVLPATPVEVRQ